MPIPIIIGLIIAGIVGVGATIWFKWDDIVLFFRGKKIVILGEAAVGKTTMHQFLRNGVIPEEHLGTVRENVNGNRFKLDDLKLNLKAGIDIGGLEDFLAEWKEIFLDSDFCFYLFNADKVYNCNTDYIEKVTRHLTHIKKWNDGKARQTPVFLIGTFADKIEEFRNYDGGDFQNFESKFRKSLSDAILQGDVKNSAVVVGSLQSDKYRSQLVARLLKQVSGT